MCIRDRHQRDHGGHDEQHLVGLAGNHDFLGQQLEHVGERLQQPLETDAVRAHAHVHGADHLALPVRQVGDAPVSYTHLDVYKRQVLQFRDGNVLQQGLDRHVHHVGEGLGIDPHVQHGDRHHAKNHEFAAVDIGQFTDCLLYTSRCV